MQAEVLSGNGSRWNGVPHWKWLLGIDRGGTGETIRNGDGIQ